MPHTMTTLPACPPPALLRSLASAALCLLLAALAPQAHSAICRVVPVPPQAGQSGSDWANAMTLQEALSTATCTEIWAQHGTYRPPQEMDPTPADPETEAARTKAFVIERPLKLYGGFAGTEATLAERVLNNAQPTILSGDLQNNDDAAVQGYDLLTDATRLDNSYHVLVMGGLSENANTVAYTPANTVLDGLTIKAGNANEEFPFGTPHNRGAGLWCRGHSNGSAPCSPTISHVHFENNSAVGIGGGMFNDFSAPIISNARFTNNRGGYGGGIYIGQSDLRISSTIFDSNVAIQGGGIYSFEGPIIISDSTFLTNSAWVGGAIDSDSGDLNISNTTFSGNTAITGGALSNSGNAIISNSTFSGNSAANEAGAAYLSDRSYSISNSTFSNNTSGTGGGALYDYESSSGSISNSMFSDNAVSFSGGGGAIHYEGSISPSISSSTFSGNTSKRIGGAISNITANGLSISSSTFSGNTSDLSGGAIYSARDLSISSSTFSGNTSHQDGGVIYNSNSSPRISNSTFSDNTATGAGGVIFNSNSNPSISASILWGNTSADNLSISDINNSTPTVSYSLVEGGWAGTDNLDINPVLSPLAYNGGFTHTMLPAAPGSYLCTAVTPPPTTDQRGAARPTTGTNCHRGAVQVLQTPAMLTVTTSGVGTGTVSSSPAGINLCASHPVAAGTCSASLSDAVTLTATASAGSVLTGWSGSGASACTSAANTCTVLMDTSKTVQAHFGTPTASNTNTPGGDVTLDLSGAQCTLSSGPTYSAAPVNGLPAGYTALGYGQIGFTATNCTPGGTVTVTWTLSSAPPANARLFKWNGSSWETWAFNLNGSALTYSVTDSGAAGGTFNGDSDPTPGDITDPAMLMVPLAAAAGTVAIPTLSQWALALMALLLGSLAAWRLGGQRPRRRQR